MFRVSHDSYTSQRNIQGAMTGTLATNCDVMPFTTATLFSVLTRNEGKLHIVVLPMGEGRESVSVG